MAQPSLRPPALLRSTPTSRNRPRAGTTAARPVVAGKFLSVGGEKFFPRGTTYGAFRPDQDGREYPDLEQVRRDFALMAESGMNAVRIPHTMPPVALLDIAQECGLKVMVGLSAEQYVGYLIDAEKAPDIEAHVADKVKTCAGHPALLCYALGNEIPASVARWIGRRRIERYLKRLYTVVKELDPGGLVTYVNYPSTEYLQLPFLDFVSFNVYLEEEDRLQAYLARLQNLAGERPLLMTELGLDGLRHGDVAQADCLTWQIRTTFAAGCAGAFVFSWTDEWFRGGAEVDDWAFGVTTRERDPKLALMAVQRGFEEVPFAPESRWPSISVVVCVYNGQQTIRDCCEGLRRLDYPDYEVIIVDDGSRDATSAIAAEYDFRLIRTKNEGLANARNTGLAAATGEIIAYTDGDAWPDPDWLTYTAATFMDSEHAAVGGWNISPPDDPPFARCVAHAPGRPVHVLLSDLEAEHIPGVSMAFRRAALENIRGFDPQFRAAGDDVDVCWRLLETGSTLGFAHGALVWHRHRDSLKAYWKQQRGYGHAEALLENKWPQKYNAPGHLTWTGRLYGHGLTQPLRSKWRIYHGMWGAAPFQCLVTDPPGVLHSLSLMPEWYFAIAVFAALALGGLVWTPLLIAVVPLVLSLGVLVAQAVSSARSVSLRSHTIGSVSRLTSLLTTSWLHLLQPVARLWGRLRHGLTPWRQRRTRGWSFPWRRRFSVWTRQWQALDERLRAVQEGLQQGGASVRLGGDYDRWDLEVRAGLLGGARSLMAIEDTGSGTQLVRTQMWPRVGNGTIFFVVASAMAATLAVAANRFGMAVAPALVALFIMLRTVQECGFAIHAVLTTVEEHGAVSPESVDKSEPAVTHGN